MANNSPQQELNKKLADAAEKGDRDLVQSLIDKGAEVNGRHCLDGCRHTPLMKAAIKGDIAIITLLLDKGADPELRDSEGKTAEGLAAQNNRPDVVARLQVFGEQSKMERVIFTSSIGDRTRQDIFDFTTKERVTLIRKEQYGEVESAVITGFSAIEDQSDTSLLRKAFNEHVKRGGQIPEAEIFIAARLYKPKTGLQKP